MSHPQGETGLTRRDDGIALILIAESPKKVIKLAIHLGNPGLFEGFGRDLLDFYGYLDEFDAFRQNYAEWGAWIVGIGGVTPVPYKVITIASGMTGLNIGVFIGVSILSRGIRFFVVCWLMWYFGQRLRGFIEKHLG